MNGYQYIQSFYKAILQQSLSIQGRFIVLPNRGNELNADDFSQVLTSISKEPGVKFPLCAMLPPRSQGIFGKMDEWEDYVFDLFFLNTSFYTGANQIANRHSGTNTSSKPVIQEWDEMKVAATDFMRVLQLVQKGQNNTSVNMLNNLFRLSNEKKNLQPVSFAGTHRLSGVHLQFKASVFTTCAIQDYTSGAIVVLP